MVAIYNNQPKPEDIMLTAFIQCVVLCAFFLILFVLAAAVEKLIQSNRQKLSENHEDEYVEYEEIPYDEAA